MTLQRRMPAEWEPHRATWIAWPHNPNDWPGKFSCISWVYAEITRAISRSEIVEILCYDQKASLETRKCLDLHRVNPNKYRLHCIETDRSWLRDSAPTMIKNGTNNLWVQWQFNAWAKYDNFQKDLNVPEFIAKQSNIALERALRPDDSSPLILEGGAIETNGEHTLLVTEECLLSQVQERNPKLDKVGYEEAFKIHLGIENTIWLIAGCEGDDTHGHIDDVARFSDANTVLLAFEQDPSEAFHEISVENEKILLSSKSAKGQPLSVVRLPMPEPIYFGEDRLPASYANFYITNNSVLVPTFNDPSDRHALNIIAQAFPGREIIGIASLDLVLGFGTLHCLSQQELL